MQIIYPAFVLFILLESLVEAAISRKNSSVLIARGAIDVAPYLLPLMVLLYLFQFDGSVFEYYKAAREVSFNWLIIFGSIVLAAKALKFWAISALGSFWTMKVLIVPGSQAVTKVPLPLDPPSKLHCSGYRKPGVTINGESVCNLNVCSPGIFMFIIFANSG